MRFFNLSRALDKELSLESRPSLQGLLFKGAVSAGVENVSDHGTIGPRKCFGFPENISNSSSTVAEKENVKKILIKVKEI